MSKTPHHCPVTNEACNSGSTCDDGCEKLPKGGSPSSNIYVIAISHDISLEERIQND